MVAAVAEAACPHQPGKYNTARVYTARDLKRIGPDQVTGKIKHRLGYTAAADHGLDSKSGMGIALANI